MRIRAPSFVVVLVAALTWAPAALAQAPPPPCTNADKIGCSYSAVYGWVAGNVAPQDVVRDPKAQNASTDAAAQAERDRQANDQMISDMAAQQRARQAGAAQATALMMGGVGETPKQAYQRYSRACIVSNWAQGCGNAAELLYEHPEIYCEEEYANNPYAACSPDRVRAELPAYNGCISGDGYACDVQQRIRAAAGAPTLAPSTYGTVAPVQAPAPAPSVAVAKAKPCGLASMEDDLPPKETSTSRWKNAYGRFAEARRLCTDGHSVKDCLTAATMTLDDPKFDCQAWRDRKIRSCPHPLEAAYWYADLGCVEYPVSKDEKKACALKEKLKVQIKQAGGC